MDIQERIREKLLELGIESVLSCRRARLAYAKNGDEPSKNDMIQAAILHHGVCQMAEFMGICSYCEFEVEIRQRAP